MGTQSLGTGITNKQSYVESDIIITTSREAGIPDADILELINRSYKIWAEHELDGPFLHYTVEDFQQATRQANVFVAIERATGKLLGTHSLQLRRKQGCVHGSLLAVAPAARGRGIASRMLEVEGERARKAGFIFSFVFLFSSSVHKNYLTTKRDIV